MMHLLRDARLGLRLLWRQPAFTTVAVLALALGVAANSAIFSVVYATLLAPLPYERPEELVVVSSRLDNNRNVTAAGDYLEWVRQSTSFQGLYAWATRSVSFSERGHTDSMEARVGTPGYITTHGFRVLLGRDFLPHEGIPGNDQVAVLTNRLWRTRFGADMGIINRQIRIDGKPHTIVGVLAPGASDRMEAQIFLPLAFTPDQINHDFRWLLVLGRLKTGVTLAQANDEMMAISKRLADTHPRSNAGWTATVEPLKNTFVERNTIATLWLLLGAVGFVLLIACANVANLLLARGTARRREVAVRAALGASRLQLSSQFFVESLVLAAAGGVLGLALAAFLMDGIMSRVPANALPSEADVRMNIPVLLFTFGVSMLAGMLFGSAPAWQVRRTSLNDVLNEAGRSAIGGGRLWLRRIFVVAEFALAMTLLAGAGLAIVSVVKLMRVDLGFRTDHLLTFAIPMQSERLKTPEQMAAFYREFTERLQATTGVTSASVSTGIPVMRTWFGLPFTLVGRPVSNKSQRPFASFNMVSPAYFRTFGIHLQRGRSFTEQDDAGAPRVAIVNDAFVRTHLTGLDPLKQRLVIEQVMPGTTKLGPGLEWQIVGVYPAVRNGGPRGDFPEIDVPFAQSPWPGAVVGVRTVRDPDSMRISLASIVESVAPELSMRDVKTMEQRVHESLASDRFMAVLFGGFAATALVLAALGIYGVMSFAVAQRRHEIGLRMALGARRSQVIGEILRDGMTTSIVGVGLGSVGAYLAGRAMKSMLFGVDAIDPVAFSIVTGLLLAAAVLACLVPATRAASVDPMTALRQE
jgi:putative ABC transport system permease protein